MILLNRPAVSKGYIVYNWMCPYANKRNTMHTNTKLIGISELSVSRKFISYWTAEALIHTHTHSKAEYIFFLARPYCCYRYSVVFCMLLAAAVALLATLHWCARAVMAQRAPPILNSYCCWTMARRRSEEAAARPSILYWLDFNVRLSHWKYLDNNFFHLQEMNSDTIGCTFRYGLVILMHFYL